MAESRFMDSQRTFFTPAYNPPLKENFEEEGESSCQIVNTSARVTPKYFMPIPAEEVRHPYQQ